MRKILTATLLTSFVLIQSGCGSLRYLLQAGKGQFELINRAKPIPDVIKDERTPLRIKALLSEIKPIKAFGEKNGLKPTSNYTEYVKLDRAAAVWVVSACEPLRFKAKKWSFPFVGTFPYLGWFDLKSAKSYAEDLREEGWDVDVRGAGAYSTVGWFRDAVLSTMIPEGEEALGDLVNVILHESVHATVYIKSQSTFNESIASFVADHLTLRYLDEMKGPQSPEKTAYVKAGDWARTVEKNLHEAYLKLSELYASSKSDSEKLEQKKALLSKLMSHLHFKREINNATLIQFKTYNTGQKDFEKLIHACGGDWSRFMKAAGALSPGSFPQSQMDSFNDVIQSLVERGCPK